MFIWSWIFLITILNILCLLESFYIISDVRRENVLRNQGFLFFRLWGLEYYLWYKISHLCSWKVVLRSLGLVQKFFCWKPLVVRLPTRLDWWHWRNHVCKTEFFPSFSTSHRKRLLSRWKTKYDCEYLFIFVCRGFSFLTFFSSMSLKYHLIINTLAVKVT